MNVRRALVILSFAVVAAIAGIPSAVAAPSATFSSPTSAVAGAPMWIKSITPCPSTPSDHIQFVTAWVVPQEEPTGEPLASVYGDLAADGSWRVTLSAPDGTPSGATASYFVRAICVVRDPYPATASSAGDDISQEYAVRSLLVTSSGGEGSGGGPAIPGTTTTTTSTTTTSTTTSTTSTTVAAAGFHSAGLDSPHLDSSYPNTSSYQPKLDSDEQDYSLDAVPASGSRQNDDGGGSDVSGLLLFVAVLAGLGAGGWQLSRFTKR